LVVALHPRNPCLADVFKRIGLTERTGRGVDLIYQGMLRYGRPAPDYSATSPTSVVISLAGGKADIKLLRIILEEEARMQTNTLPVDTLIALNLLRRERRIDVATLAHAIQRDQSVARNLLERLVETGLVEAHGVKKGRIYTLSSHVYRKLGESSGYICQIGFDDIQQEQMVLQFVKQHGQITRSQAVELCRIGDYQASRLLRKLTNQGKLKKEGERKSSVYFKGPAL
jgi:ATP-dependent DNA helicase RecG